jgi:hypothetical protein
VAIKNGPGQPPAPAVLAEIKAIVGRARQGDAAVLPRLRELLEDYPALWRHFGDLAAQAEVAWASLVAGQDLYLRESLLRQAEALRQELAGPGPSPVERLLVERVVACWMQMAYFDTVEAQSLGKDERPRLAALRAKRQEQAHRMYLTSLAALTTLRKLLPGAAAKVPPPAPDHDPASGERNGHHRNSQAVDLPHVTHNRLAGLFDDILHSGNKESQREKRMCPAGAGD